MKLLKFIKKLFSNTKTEKAKKRALTDDEFNEIRSAKEKKMNKILEKISASGFDSLSEHEKNFLQNYTK